MDLTLPKVIAAGIYNSDIAVKNRVVTRNRKTTMFEIEIPIENGGISFIDDEHKNITKNMLICAKPGQIRHSKLPFKCYYIHIIVKSGYLYDTLINLPDFIKLSNPKKFHKIFEKINYHYQTGATNDKIMVQSLILNLIHELGNIKASLSLHNAKSNNYLAVEKAIDYINNNLSNPLTLEEISKVVSFSPIYLHNLFKQSTGKTLREFVEEQRFSKAINLLMTTNMTLTKIAYECGFSSQAYFSYAFKRKMHIPPKEYAKLLTERYHKY